MIAANPPITLQAIQSEFGTTGIVASSTPAGLDPLPTAMLDFLGKSAPSLTIATNQQELNLRTWALANGWNGSSPATITVAAGVYIWSNNIATPALTIDGSWPNGVTLINNGYIMGKGGKGAEYGPIVGENGGSAISLGRSVTIDNTNASAYMGGGGGGGGAGAGTRAGGGGGGAGGGAGGAYGSGGGVTLALGGAGGGVGATGGAPTSSAFVSAAGGGSGGGGGMDQVIQTGLGRSGPVYQIRTSGGAGGGRIFPGTGGVGGSNGTAIGGDGGSNTNLGGNANVAVNTNNVNAGAGGGGGWGAAGGTGISYNSGVSNGSIAPGSGGRAVQLNGYSVTWVSNNTDRVWGAVS